jgi:hypothetical protein
LPQDGAKVPREIAPGNVPTERESKDNIPKAKPRGKSPDREREARWGKKQNQEASGGFFGSFAANSRLIATGRYYQGVGLDVIASIAIDDWDPFATMEATATPKRATLRSTTAMPRSVLEGK